MSHFIPPREAKQDSSGYWIYVAPDYPAYQAVDLATLGAAFAFESAIQIGYFPPHPDYRWANGKYMLPSTLVKAESQRVSIPKKDFI